MTKYNEGVEENEEEISSSVIQTDAEDITGMRTGNIISPFLIHLAVQQDISTPYPI